MASQSTAKSLFLFILKLVIAGVIVYYLLLRDPGEIMRCLKHIDGKYVLAAAVLYFLHMAAAAVRWGCLVKIPGLRISWFEVISLSMQGYFFSLVIPGGAIGGDVVKMGVLSQRTPKGEKFEGIFSILMDRIIGMIALFVMALCLIPLNIPVLLNLDIPGLPRGNAVNQLLLAGLILLCLGGLAASCVIFFHRPLSRIFVFSKLMQYGDKLSHGMVSRMTSATDTYSSDLKALSLLTLFSVFAVHLLTALPVFLLLEGMGVACSLNTVITALTIGNIIGLIPLFPAGLGGRDLTAVAILTAGGIAGADAKTALLVYSAILLLVSLAAGLFFIFDRGRRQTNGELEKKNE